MRAFNSQLELTLAFGARGSATRRYTDGASRLEAAQSGARLTWIDGRATW